MRNDGVITRKRSREEEQQRIEAARSAAKGIGEFPDNPSTLINQVIATTQLPKNETDLLLGVVWRDRKIRPSFSDQASSKTVCLKQESYTKFYIAEEYEATYMKIAGHLWDPDVRNFPYSSISPESFATRLVEEFQTPKVQKLIHASGSLHRKNRTNLINRQRLYFYAEDDNEVKGYNRAYYERVIPCDGSNVVDAFSIWLKKQSPHHREGSAAALFEPFVSPPTARFEHGQIVSIGDSDVLDYDKVLPLLTETGKIVTTKHHLPFDVNDVSTFRVESDGRTLPLIRDI